MANNSDKTFRDLLNSGQAQILGIVSMVPMGNWNGTTTYQKLNYVRNSATGATYLAMGSNINVEPGVTANWEKSWMLCNYDGGSVNPQGTYPDMTVGKVVNALFFGSKSYDGSSQQTITAADLGVSSVYTPQGSISFASLPQTPSANELGYVWNISDSFTTDSRFLEGAGIVFAAGTNVGVIENNGNYYYDVLGAFFDLSNYVTKTQVATSSSLGLIQLGYQKNEKNYPVELDSNNRAYVNVPWDGANYSAGTGLELSEQGVFSLETPVSVANGGTGKTDLDDVTVGNATSAETAEKVANALTVTVNGEETEYDGSAAAAVTVSASNPNLLYNSNFAINQRGNSSYTSAGYTVDGWRKTSSSGTVYLNSGPYPPINNCLYFSETSGVYLRQYLETSLKRSTTYTITIGYNTATSVYLSYETSYTFTTPSGTSTTSTTWTPFTGYQVTIYPSGPLASGHSYVQFGRTSSSGTTYYFHYIKLEEGSVATPYEFPNPAEELLKCQRYYLKQTTGCQIPGSVGNGGNHGYVTLWLPVPMRTTTPTIVSYSVDGLRLQGNSYSTVTSISDGVLAGTAFYFKYDSSASYDSFQPVSLALDAIELSAELTS